MLKQIRRLLGAHSITSDERMGLIERLFGVSEAANSRRVME